MSPLDWVASASTTLPTCSPTLYQGNGKYNGPTFSDGQYVIIDDDTKNHYSTGVDNVATNRASASPHDAFAADPDITASDAPNAAQARRPSG